MWTFKIKGKVCKMKLRNEEYKGKKQTEQEKRKTGNAKLSSTNYERTYFFSEKLKFVTLDKKI